MLSGPRRYNSPIYEVDAITAPILQMGLIREAKPGNAAGMQELVEVDSLSMTLLFGERESGGGDQSPLHFTPKSIAPVRRGAHEEKPLRRKEALLQ